MTTFNPATSHIDTRMDDEGIFRHAEPILTSSTETGESIMLQMKMSDGGRVVIPAEIRHSLGLKEGDTVLFELLEGEARITSRQAQLQRARALFRRYVPADAPSPADELIAERRAEAARE